MSSFSVDGLVSGLDTTTLIKQLMQLERQPVVRLQARRSDVQKVIDLYRQLNTRFDAVETAAEKLARTTGWQAAKATSSDDAVATVTTSTGALQGTLSFEVTALAKAHSVIGAVAVADPATDVVASGDITIGDTTIAAADLGDGTLEDVARAINASGAGVRASIVQVAPGQHRLQLTATETGSAGVFDVSGLDALGPFAVVTQGTDARITVGDGPGAYEVVSSTNTFTGVLAGTTITVRSLGTATVSVERDDEALADAVEALVRSVNDATGLIRTNSTYDAVNRKAGLLLSDHGADRLRRSLTDAISRTVIDGRTASAVGLSVTKDGLVTFDRETFLAALEEDPAAVERFFGANDDGTADDGVAEQLRRIADEATQYGTGQITTAIEQRETTIRSIDQQIASWEVRLDKREAALRRQFSALESALSSLASQSTWLAGAIGSLPSAWR